MKIELTIDFRPLAEMLPSADWAVENGLLTEDEAIEALVDEALATLKVKNA